LDEAHGCNISIPEAGVRAPREVWIIVVPPKVDKASTMGRGYNDLEVSLRAVPSLHKKTTHGTTGINKIPLAPISNDGHENN
jgi:hypothetical protein